MKRVIVMSWLKRVKDRLLGEEQYEDELSEQQELLETDDVQLNSTTKPKFRFPVISDDEIYGRNQHQLNEQAFEKVTEYDDDFEPIPLYKNDRWPEETNPGAIYTARNSSALFERQRMEEKKRSEPFFAEKRAVQIEERSPILNKRPFTPSPVPSPVYGLQQRVERTQRQLVESEIEPEIEKEQSEAIQTSSRMEKREDEHTNSQQYLVEQEELNEQLEEIEEIEAGNDESFYEIIDQTEMENEQKPIQEEFNVEEGQVPETIVVQQEEKVEKIVPFNVLMLNSDKEKLRKRMENQQVLSTSPIRDESTKREIVSELQEKQQAESEKLPHYALPSLHELIPPEAQVEDTEWLESQSIKLEEALSHFSIQATVTEAVQGPTVTRFEFTVGHGTKVSKVRNLTDDLKLALAAEDIRIQAPIPGTSSIGIEIPNRTTRAVRISEVIRTPKFQQSTSPLEAVLGLSLTGEPVTLDLRSMPHGMIAGATGSGKSVCINSILISLLYKATPSDLQLLLIDPKMVELAPFNGIPHLISPVITDVKAATAALKWAVGEMERRYELFAHAGARNIERYNQMVIQERQFSLKLPYLVIIIDELADLMMMAPADVEVSISRIAQKARACGIHLIIATQRPSVDVITGIIKANIPTRIAFAVSSQIDSRTILDTAGAERLLGKGDMLYVGNGQSSAQRLQGTFVTDDEIERIIEHVQNEATPNYLFGQEDLLATAIEEEETDPLFDEACAFIIEQGSASTSMLQRHFSIGYNRAAKLMDRMEANGFISEQKGSKARDVFLTESQLHQIMNEKQRL